MGELDDEAEMRRVPPRNSFRIGGMQSGLTAARRPFGFFSSREFQSNWGGVASNFSHI